jgi:hypothetical protein
VHIFDTPDQMLRPRLSATFQPIRYPQEIPLKSKLNFVYTSVEFISAFLILKLCYRTQCRMKCHSLFKICNKFLVAGLEDSFPYLYFSNILREKNSQALALQPNGKMFINVLKD